MGNSAQHSISEDLVRELSDTIGEPDWMTSFRLRSLETYRQQPEPTGQIKTSDLPLMNMDLSIEDLIPDEDRRNERTEQKQEDALSEEYRDRGVLFEPLSQAVREHPDLVRRYFMRHAVPPGRSTYASLHGALWNGGSFVYVPEGVDVDIPLTVYHQTASDTPNVFLHQLIVAEPGANVQFFEGCSTTDGPQTRTVLGCVEAIVRRNARVQYSTLQDWGSSTFNVSEKQAVVKRNGHMVWTGGNIGSRMTEVIPSTVLEGTGASCRHVEFGLAGARQRLCGGANVAHRSPNTSSDILIRSAAKDGGEIVQLGDLSMENGSKRSESRIQCDEIQLDTGSRSVSHQHLDINEYEVDVQQETTSGPLPRQKLRYMRSKGIAEKQAQNMLLEAFLKPIFDVFPPEFVMELKKQLYERSETVPDVGPNG